MKATVCAVLLAFLLGACATSGAGDHGADTGAHHRSTGVVRIHASLVGGAANGNAGRPVSHARISVIGSGGRRWHGRTTSDGIRTFRLPPGRYVVSVGSCGGRRMHIHVLAKRVLPLHYACPLRPLP